MLAIEGSSIGIYGDAEAIQVTSMDVEEFSGEVSLIVIDGSVDCGGICGGGGSVDGNAEIVAAGEIEMTDVNIDAVNLSIENEDGSWTAEIGNAASSSIQINNCGTASDGTGDGMVGGSSDLGALTAADSGDIAIGKEATATGPDPANGAIAIGSLANAEGDMPWRWVQQPCR